MHDGHHDDHDHAPITDGEGSVSRFEVLEQSIRELLIEKGILSAQAIADRIDVLDSRNPSLGAQVVARAWTDEAYKARLLADPRAAIGELGIDIGHLAEFGVLENTDQVHHVVVCTLCSCYPKMLLGVPPAWYKSSAYRGRTVREPRAVLGEFGVTLADDVAVRVYDSTADLRYLVLPRRPDATAGWDADQLAAIVTRDCMIGTALPQA
ncbi:MAG: nitrile hydratase subunit alpha [Pseudomonadota bacterium]